MSTIELDSAVCRTLRESMRAVPWKIDWAAATFAYLGPQIEGLHGIQAASARANAPSPDTVTMSLCVARVAAT